MCPIYEYICPRCERELEVLQTVNDPVPMCICSDDPLIPMVKQISKGSFILKGSGWAVDGYSKKKSKK